MRSVRRRAGQLRRRASHPMVSTAAARLGSLVPISIATFVVSKVVIDHFGVPVFNGYALMMSTMALLPLADIGIGTAVTNAFAIHGPDHEESTRLALTAARVLVVLAVGMAAGSLALSATGAWDAVLGDGVEAGPAFGVGIAAYAAGLLPGLSQSMLLGINRAHLTVIVLTFHIPLTAVAVGVAAALDAPSWTIVIMPAAALTVVRLVMAAVCARVAHVHWRSLLARLPRRRRHPGLPIRSTMSPSLVIALSSPLARQSDRLVLSHFSTQSAVANHAVAMQLFAPLLGVVAAAAQPLWPMFTRAQAHGTKAPSVRLAMIGFGLITAMIGAAVVLVADPIGNAIGGDDISLGWATPIAAAILMVGQASIMPLSMAMKSPAALRFAATCSVIALPLNIGLSIVLAGRLGAPGPLFASAIVGITVQVIPALRWYRRHHGGATLAPLGPDGVDVPLGPESAPTTVVVPDPVPTVPPAAADPVPAPAVLWSHERLGGRER